MPSQKEDQAFISHLLITHGLAILVSGLQEDGKDIIPLAGVTAPLVNEASQGLVQDLHSFVGAATARRGPAVWEWQEHRGDLAHILCDGGHGCTKFVGFGKEVGGKERFADDTHGEIDHLLIEINDGTISPGLLQVFTVRSHHLGIAGDMARLERGSHELALVAVKIALATEDAIAEDRTNALPDDHAFVEVVGMFDQNTVHMFW